MALNLFNSGGFMTVTTPETFTLSIGNVTREVPLVRLASNRRLPLVEFLGDIELCKAAARELQTLLPKNAEVLFTCETSSIPLVHDLAQLTNLPYEVARKRRRPYMSNPLIQDVASMTLGVGETLWLDSNRAANIKGKRVVIVLDVVASGGTINALEKLVARAGGTVCARVAAFSQGQPKLEMLVVHQLPIFDGIG
jgi:adenine phosphoribosyltransferase